MVVKEKGCVGIKKKWRWKVGYKIKRKCRDDLVVKEKGCVGIKKWRWKVGCHVVLDGERIKND
ncbi:hypothetical protein RchiOBHm_Chr4g0388731 [Rosa chinensis]|uniref:Uncharacterized protein n=1 Tax=Rosa chinensis TaxID=74649 RepID=A0A2P6QPU9_ROSCH|nr:hypothetical protein RchiOBHm_Chr4g0388731 [Rosa chinensis]